MNNNFSDILVFKHKATKIVAVVWFVIGCIVLLVGLIGKYIFDDDFVPTMLLLFSFSFFAFGLVSLCTYISRKLKFTKTLRKYDINELKNELQAEDTIEISKRTYFTKNYIISEPYPAELSIIEQSKIVWVLPMYSRNRRHASDTMYSRAYEYLVINGEDGKFDINTVDNRLPRYPYVFWDICAFFLKDGSKAVCNVNGLADAQLIYSKLYEKNSLIMFGWNKENADKYKEEYLKKQTRKIKI